MALGVDVYALHDVNSADISGISQDDNNQDTSPPPHNGAPPPPLVLVAATIPVASVISSSIGKDPPNLGAETPQRLTAVKTERGTGSVVGFPGVH